MKQIKPTNGITKFISDNAWSLLFTLVAIAVAWTTMSARVLAVENDHGEITERLDKIDMVIERIIVLEEREKSIVEDVGEIKVDIKDIKNTLNLR